MSRYLRLLQDCPKCDAYFPIEERECGQCEANNLLKEVMVKSLKGISKSKRNRLRKAKFKRDFYWKVNGSTKPHSTGAAVEIEEG